MEKGLRVYYNIDESIYYTNVGDFQFYFSSEFNLNRYKENVYTFIMSEIYKLKSKYRFVEAKTINTLKVALAITYYKKIEKRGFRVYKKGERFKEDG